MGSIGSSMSRSGRTTAASGTGRRPAIWPSCAKSPSTSWAVTEPPGSACGPGASRPPGMTSTCSLFWPADFMRRPCRLKTSRDEAYKILEERDLLLRELVHRVKNDFQAASHLLWIQSTQVTHPGTKEALRAAADRISIMGRVHTRLTHQNQCEKVNLEAFLRELAADLQAPLIGSRLISLDLDVEAILVSQKQAVYIGLIVNELLTNALKYAFPDDRLGRVVVTLKREGDHVLLQVADNGVGTLPEVVEMTGLGTGLVRTLVQLLDGTLEVESEHGMSYIARIRVDQEPE